MQDEGVALYRRFLDGDEGALEELIALYQRGLFRFINGYIQDGALAEDILQDTFVTLYYKRSFKEKEGASFKTYLYKIARNKSLNAIKKRKRKNELSLESMIETSGEKTIEPIARTLNFAYEADAQKQIERMEEIQLVQTSLNQLKSEYRETLALRYFEEMAPERIAVVTGRKVKQVYNLLARGRQALKDELTKKGYKVNDYENE